MPSASRDDGQPQFLAIARVSGVHGLKGELRALILSDFPDRFARLSKVYVGESHQPFRLETARLHKRIILLKLGGIDTPEQAETLRGKVVFIPVGEAVELAEGQYFWHQIIGLAVETVEGLHLGEITDILTTGANDVYIVKAGQREILVPAIEDVVAEIDLAAHRMLVRPIPGLLA